MCTHSNYGAHDSGGGDTAECHWVNRMVKPGSYSGDGDFNDDYAVLRLSTKPTKIGWMAISSASNSTIKNADSYKSAYPSYGPGCAANSPSPQVIGLGARRQYWMKGDLFDTTSSRIKTRLDAGPGESGGAYYYYPSGCCGSHYITGVHAGFVDVGVGNDYHGGPKGSAIRDWVATNTP
ncbi:MAG: hypothetical protein AAFX85_05390 [Pseudomonadota bacterium]